MAGKTKKEVNRVGKEYNDFCIISGNPKIGKDTWIGYFTLIDGSGGLKIGSHCSIASGVHIYTHDAVRWAVTGIEKDHEKRSHIDRAPVTIGNNVFIGANSVVLKGVKIGDNVIIGACTLVNKSIPSNSVVVGNPMRIIGKVKVSRGKLELVYF
jgi:acetyltransferase-like isoleucine patch superfamily enzyme